MVELRLLVCVSRELCVVGVCSQAMEEVDKEGLYPNPVVTELVPLEKLWAGEDYHQDYYKLNPNQVCGGCSCVSCACLAASFCCQPPPAACPIHT